MISYFTDPSDEEIMYYVLARLFRDGDYKSKEDFYKEVFGAPDRLDSPLFFNRLESIVNNLPPHHVYTSKHFLDKHTILPALIPFLPPEYFAAVKEIFLNTGSLHERMRVNVERKLDWPEKVALKCCPSCAKRDILQTGEPYFHRVHLFYGVYVCPHCKVWLLDVLFPWDDSGRLIFLTIDEAQILEIETNYVEDNDIVGNILWRYALQIQWLLEQPAFTLKNENLRNRYIQLLVNRGLGNYTGYLNWEKISKEFQDFYPEKLLTLLNCRLEKKDPQGHWLQKLTHKKTTLYPVVNHFLLANFLGITLEQLFQETEQKFFGDGPWSCYNPVCEFYAAGMIGEFSLDYNHWGEPRATVSCPVCKFTYSVLGPTENSDFSNSYKRIIDRGPVWKQRLIELWDDLGISSKDIQSMLKISYNGLKAEINKLNLQYPKVRTQQNSKPHQPTRQGRANQISDKRETYRQRLLDLIASNPSAGRSVLRDKDMNLYIWLYRHDKEWFYLNLPPSRKTIDTRRPIIEAVWQERDKKFEIMVRVRAEELYALERPVWVSKSRIMEVLPFEFATLSGGRDRLPNTKKALSEVTETSKQFAIRRINWAVEQYIIANHIPGRWELIRTAGVLERIRLRDPDIVSAIAQAMTFLKKKLSVQH